MRGLLSIAVSSFFFVFAGCGGTDSVDDGASTSSGSSSGHTVEADGGSSSSSSSSSGDAPSSSSGGSSSSSGNVSGPFACPSGTTESTVRVVAGNISNGNAQSYDDGSGLRIFKGLDADVALVQEMNYRQNRPVDLAEFVQHGFGDGFVYHRGGPNTNGAIPNGIVSRYPFVRDEGGQPIAGEGQDSQVNGTRTFVWARIDIPGDQDLVAISVHLATNASKRGAEVTELLALVEQIAHDGDLLVLGGDFNTDSRSATGIAEMSGTFVTTGPYPVDEDGKDGTNINRSKPYDWVVGNPELHARSRTTFIGEEPFVSGLVFDSRVWSDLSLVPPVLRDDSRAHQHMAVVRTFAVCE